MDPQFRDGAIDESSETEDEAADAGRGEHAMAAIFCLEHHHKDCREQQSNGRMPDREKIQAEEA